MAEEILFLEVPPGEQPVSERRLRDTVEVAGLEGVWAEIRQTLHVELATDMCERVA